MGGQSDSSDFTHPHDLLVRSTFPDEELAADFFTHYLTPRLAALIDMKRLKCESPVAVDKNLRETLADLRFSTFFKGSDRRMKVFLFLEHQSKPDRYMVLRMLEYIVRAYGQYRTTQQSKTLPYPVAVVLHHGKKPWRKMPAMRDLVDAVPGVDEDILRFPVCLVDLASIPPEQLRGNAMVRAVLECLQSASTGRLADRFEGIARGLEEFKGDFRLKNWLTALLTYTTEQCVLPDGRAMVQRILGRFYEKTEAETMSLTFAEELRLEGRVEGKAEGKAESIVTVLKARFGALPVVLSKKIETLQDQSRLDTLLIVASTCQSLSDFKKHFK